MSIGLPSLLDNWVLKRSAFALIRGSYVLIANSDQCVDTGFDQGMSTFDGEATIPGPPAQAMVVDVACHMNGALLWIVTGLAVPS